ncbi:MAG: hypothetical protein PUF50_07570 [Erysipelotrichaceae bacterium]|nr:hypothetical protein [Erysipelotrichaceae bacterium]
MKKLVVLSLLLAFLFGCQSKPQETEHLTVLSPKGAPSLALLNYFNETGEENVITTVDGTDVLTAAFTSVESEYDMIVAPINLGSKLIEKGATDYRLVAVVTWGNLYVVSKDETVTLDSLDEFAMFGQNAVPDKVLQTVMANKNQTVHPTYFNAVSDVAAQLLGGKFTTGLVAEPVASTLLAKSEGSIKIVADMQEAWKEATGKDNYPQAALFVKQSVYEEKKASVDAIIKTLSSYDADIDTLKQDMDRVGAEVLGVNSQMMSMETYQRMNVHVVKAAEVTDEIATFLQLFGIEDITNLFVK